MATATPPFRHLVLAGTTKAATTSLFAYLAAHPQVCASRYKESRFFLDPGYPVPLRDLHVERNGASAYARLFDACPERPFRLEATPDYLYSPASAERLRQIDDVRLLFVLRDPIERLRSWYRFARQNDDLPSEMTFEAYVRRQLDGDEPSDAQHWRALEQGRYLHHLTPYLARFERSELFMINYRVLVTDLRAGVQAVCRWSGIPEAFYDDFDFEVHNRGQTMRNPGMHRRFRSLRQAMRRSLGRVPLVGRTLRALGRRAEPLYLALNRSTQGAATTLPEALMRRLEDHYRQERSWLAGPALRLAPPTAPTRQLG